MSAQSLSKHPVSVRIISTLKITFDLDFRRQVCPAILVLENTQNRRAVILRKLCFGLRWLEGRFLVWVIDLLATRLADSSIRIVQSLSIKTTAAFCRLRELLKGGMVRGNQEISPLSSHGMVDEIPCHYFGNFCSVIFFNMNVHSELTACYLVLDTLNIHRMSI